MTKDRLKNTSVNKLIKTAAVLILLSVFSACTLDKEPAGETEPADIITVTPTDPQDVDVTVPEDEDEAFYDIGRWLGFDLKALGVKPRTYDTTADTFELTRTCTCASPPSST